VLAAVPFHQEICHMVFSYTVPNKHRTAVHCDEETSRDQTVFHIQIQHGVSRWIAPTLLVERRVPLLLQIFKDRASFYFFTTVKIVDENQKCFEWF
jgi:hypothetical protein